MQEDRGIVVGLREILQREEWFKSPDCGVGIGTFASPFRKGYSENWEFSGRCLRLRIPQSRTQDTINLNGGLTE